jgi:hypothetical protein
MPLISLDKSVEHIVRQVTCDIRWQVAEDTKSLKSLFGLVGLALSLVLGLP